MGKGSDVRPPSVDKDTFNKNWDAIFGNRKKKKVESTNRLFADAPKRNQKRND